MAEQLRLTVEQIKADIVKTGMTLKAWSWLNSKCDCGCPMGIHAMANGNKIPVDWCHAKFGRAYVDGFTEGFDDPNNITTFESRQTGWQDGRNARRMLLPLAPTDF